MWAGVKERGGATVIEVCPDFSMTTVAQGGTATVVGICKKKIVWENLL